MKNYDELVSKFSIKVTDPSTENYDYPEEMDVMPVSDLKKFLELYCKDMKIYNTMSNVKIVDVDMVRAMEFVRSACLEQGSFSLSCPASYGSSFFMGHLNRNTSDTIKEEVAAMITHLDKTQTVGVTFKD